MREKHATKIYFGLKSLLSSYVMRFCYVINYNPSLFFHFFIPYCLSDLYGITLKLIIHHFILVIIVENDK